MMNNSTHKDTAHSETYTEFLKQREELLRDKSRQTVRELSKDIVRLLELIAAHGSSGIAADSHRRMEYVNRFEIRIIQAVKQDYQ